MTDETPFVDPSGWRKREMAAHLRQAAATLARPAELQLAAFGRVRSLSLELAEMKPEDQNFEATRAALAEAEAELAALQAAVSAPAVEGEAPPSEPPPAPPVTPPAAPVAPVVDATTPATPAAPAPVTTKSKR